MAQTIKQLIQNYTKDVLATDEALGTFTEYAFVNVVHNIAKVKPEDLNLFTEVTAGSTTQPIDISNSIYVHNVIRDNGSTSKPRLCELIDYSTSVLLFGLLEPTSEFPKAYIKESGVYSLPAPAASNNLYINYVKHPTIDVTASTITVGLKTCPSKYFNIIIIKAAVETIINLLANKEIDYSLIIPLPPSVVSLTFDAKVIPVFSIPAAFDPITIDSDLFATKTVSLPEPPVLPVLNVPSDNIYTDGGSIVQISELPTDLNIDKELVLPQLKDIANLDIGTNLDNIIDWDETTNPLETSIELPTLSDYTNGINLVISGLDISGISAPDAPGIDISSDDLVFPSIVPLFSTAFDDLTSEFSDIDVLIDKDSADEDIELASAHLQMVNQKLQKQQQKVQTQLHDFNRQNVEFQAKLNESINNANNSNNVKVQNASSKLQEFSSKVQKYQIEINKAITEWQQGTVQQAVLTYTTERANAIQAYQVDVNAAVTKFSSEIQSRVNKVSGQIGEYNAKLNKYINEYQVQASSKISEFQAQAQSFIQEYSSVINADIQEFSNNIQKHLKKFELEQNVNLSKYRSEVEKAISSYTAEIGSVINNYQVVVNSYLTKFQTERTIEINRFQAESQQALAKFNSDIQSSVQSFQSEARIYELQMLSNRDENSLAINNYQSQIQKYSAEIQAVIQQANIELQKDSLDYQWLANQLRILQNEYNEFFFSGYQQPQKEEVANG